MTVAYKYAILFSVLKVNIKQRKRGVFMGMFSEIATESTIKVVVEEIKKEIEASKDKPDVVVALKKLGRFALTQFEWAVPAWAKEYDQLFRN